MSVAPAPPASPESKRILVVDDEQLVLTALGETLRVEGYEVFAFEDPAEALPFLKTTRFSVILIDQQMPPMTGLEFLGHAKVIQPNATRILVTAVLDLSTVIQAINRGEVYRFIVKPWLREELLVTLRNAVQRYDLICHNAALHAESVAINQRLAAQLGQLDTQNQQLAQLNEALHENLDRSAQLSVKMMETFYPLLGKMARRVTTLCEAMAGSLDLSADHRQVLDLSSQLYDIGLVRVRRQVIRAWVQSPDSLTSEDRAAIEQHPAMSEELVGFVGDLEAVGATIRYHHERFDGQGYPDKLAGDQIPWLARLLAVAVAYCQHPGGDGAALEHVRTNSGAAFDPEAVRAFMRVLPQITLPRNQRAVLLAELEPGMVVSQGIYTAQGVLLVPEGQTLTEPHINMLRNHNRITPIAQSLLVYG
jgi:response regulator RpfG family c-di-GMP phosphodiesterase